MVLELREVEKTFPAPLPVEVLRGVSLVLQPGETVAILGPSGCGKSTLLNILGLLARPTTGSVLVNGESTNDLPSARLAALRAGHLGFVFQLHHLLPQCTVRENVLLPLAADREASREVRDRRAERGRMLLERVGLAERLDASPETLSGGERQRVALVRSLVNEPAAVLADEPTGNLDSRTARDVADLLFELSRSDEVTLVLVTHSAELAARAERVLSLREGRLE